MENKQEKVETEQYSDKERFSGWLSRVLLTFPLKLLGINLLFLVFCIPVISIPAALCALHAAIQRFYREMYSTTVLQNFVGAFLEAFVRRTVLILGLFIIPAVVLVFLRTVLPEPMWLVLAAFFAAALLVLYSWLIPQLVYLNLTPGQALKNALIFLCIETNRVFALIAIHAVGLTILVFGLPVSAFLLLVLPVLDTVLVTGIVMPVLKKYLAQ